MEAPAPQDVSPGPHGSLMRNGSDISAPDTIVLIHGLWMTPHSWDKWVDRYSSRAYRVIAPAWPGLDRDIADFQAGLANLTPKQKAPSVEWLTRMPVVLGTPPAPLELSQAT